VTDGDITRSLLCMAHWISREITHIILQNTALDSLTALKQEHK